MLAPNVFQTDIVFVKRFDLRFEIAAQQAHEEIDFRLRTLLPVFLGKGVERQRRNADARGGFDRGTHGGHTGAMSGDARHVPSPGPTPVSVHDDGDMLGKTRPIEPQVNVRFLALHPRRNRVSQAELSESKLTHEIQCVQCDGSFHAQQLASSAPLPEKIGRISLAMWRMTVKADRSSAERGPAAYSPRFGGISSDRA